MPEFDWKNLYLVSTRSFMLSDIPKDLKNTIISLAMMKVSPKTDFIIFDPKTTRQEQYEDQGRSLRLGMPRLTEKVYAKLDDYGSKETLSKSVGHPVNTQYVLTIMLAEDY